MTALAIRGLTRGFADHPVLTELDLDVPASSITALLGPSGCGKTTLLRIVAGFLDPAAGTILFGDRLVVGDGTSVPARRRRVGYVPQEGALFPHLTVAANIGFGLRRRSHDRARVDAALDLVELPHRVRDHYPHELSGGQQQRVALARALAPEPAIVLLDEPFSSLDAGLRESTGLAVARALRAASATAVLVTHDQTEALSLADQVAVMRDGRIAQLDRPVDLYRLPADPDIARFVGGASVLAATVRGGVAHCALGEIDVAGAVDAGDVVVVVRPEQIHLSADHGASGGPDGRARARVDSVSYYGHDASVRLDVLPDGPRVIARVEGGEPPEAGALVRVRVAGRSPVFARPTLAPTDGRSE
jgi:iron(III) transport system ATP-binding protein